MSVQATEKTYGDAGSLDLSQAQTSSVSIPLSDTFSDATVRILITQCHNASWNSFVGYFNIDL